MDHRLRYQSEFLTSGCLSVCCVVVGGASRGAGQTSGLGGGRWKAELGAAVTQPTSTESGIRSAWYLHKQNM